MFDYNEEIREMLASSGLTDPHEIGSKVVEQIPPRELRGVARALMTLAVRNVIRATRKVPPLPPQPNSNNVTNPRPIPGKSKWADYQSHRPLWEIAGEGYGYLDEFTVDQVRALADQYRVQAGRYASKADRFDRLADSMEAAGVKVCGDLPVEIFQEVWT